MKNRALAAAVFAALAAAPRPVAASEPFDFLFIDGSARPAGMGGAYTTLAADSNALHYNPAGLGLNAANEAGFMHEERFGGINHEHIAFASRQGWGVDLQRLAFGGAQRASYSNPSGTGLGSADLTETAFSAGYGHRLVSWLSAGVSLKLVSETIDGATGSGQAVDFGILGSVPEHESFRYGAAIQNIGPDVKFEGQRENLPLNFRFGVSYESQLAKHPIITAFDLTKRRTGSVGAHVGVEASVTPMFPIRFGVDTSNDAGPGVSFGLGLRRSIFAFDYAFEPYGDLGSSHRFSVAVRWGETKVAIPSRSYVR